MKLRSVITTATAIALGVSTYTFASQDSAMFFRRSEKDGPVNLAGVATVQMPSGFDPVGNGRIKTDDIRGFDPKMLEFHRNEKFATFPFEKDQSNNMGGYSKNPILLNVTLWNPSLADDELLRIGGTTIHQFYPPVDDSVRNRAHFDAQQWLPDVRNGAALTRVAETNRGRGDELSSAPPARWLVIHVDPVKRIRVDLYAWQKKYSQEEARALVTKIAGSVTITPQLATVFDQVQTLEARLAARHDKVVAAAITALAPCGISMLAPGESTLSGECGAWLSSDKRYLHVARSLGRVPHPGTKRANSEVPEFKVADVASGKPAGLLGPKDFEVLTFYWDAKASSWGIEDLGGRMYDDEPRASALVAAISGALTDRNSVYIVSLARYDTQFHADRVAVELFLTESNRVAELLRSGKGITGVSAIASPLAR